MGGTVTAIAASGTYVTSAVLTDGGRAPNPFSWPREKMVAVRKREAEEAGGVLGVRAVIFFDLLNLIDETKYETARTRLRDLLGEVKPAEVYTLHPDLDRHGTHRLAGRLTLESVSSANLSTSPPVWAYETWGLFRDPDRLEMIDERIGTKLRAIERHRSQTASVPYSDGVVGLNRWRALFADPLQTEPAGAYAEAFLLLLGGSPVEIGG